MFKSNNPEVALLKFNNLFLPVVDKHAPWKKFTVRNAKTPWLDNEIKNAIKRRIQMKITATKAGNKEDWDLYRKIT